MYQIELSCASRQWDQRKINYQDYSFRRLKRNNNRTMNMVCQKNGITIPFGEVIPFTFTFVHSLKGGPGGVNPFPYICVDLIISCCFMS